MESLLTLNDFSLAPEMLPEPHQGEGWNKIRSWKEFFEEVENTPQGAFPASEHAEEDHR